MRKSAFYLLLVSSLALCVVSCKKEKSVKELEEKFIVQPEETFQSGDTAEVKKLADEFIEHLNNKSISSALHMLYFLDGDSIVELPAGLAKRQANALANMQGIRYTVERIVFDNEKDNQVKINVVLFEKKEDDNRPNTISFYLKPVRRDGKWYLTTVDNITDTNNLSGSQIEN